MNIFKRYLFLKSSALGLLILCNCTWVYADVLFDSTSNPVFDLDLVNSDVTLNASFSTKEKPITLTKVTVLWKRVQNENGLIRVNLLSDDKVSPGLPIAELAEVDARLLPLGERWLNIPLKTEITLMPNRRYWLQIKASAPSGSMAYSREHKGLAIKSEYYLNMYGLHRNSETGPYILKIEGEAQKP